MRRKRAHSLALRRLTRQAHFSAESWTARRRARLIVRRHAQSRAAHNQCTKHRAARNCDALLFADHAR